MVRFVDVANMTQWIAQEGVESIITGMVDSFRSGNFQLFIYMGNGR